jgi:hypothetical protein
MTNGYSGGHGGDSGNSGGRRHGKAGRRARPEGRSCEERKRRTEGPLGGVEGVSMLDGEDTAGGKKTHVEEDTRSRAPARARSVAG